MTWIAVQNDAGVELRCNLAFIKEYMFHSQEGSISVVENRGNENASADVGEEQGQGRLDAEVNNEMG